MAKKLKEIMAEIPQQRQEKIKAKAEKLLLEIISEETLLENIDKAKQQPLVINSLMELDSD
jgi:hypothetical protein